MPWKKPISYADAAKALGITESKLRSDIDRCHGPVFVQLGPRKIVQLDRGSLSVKEWQEEKKPRKAPAKPAKGK